jgi:hypothetical protein
MLLGRDNHYRTSPSVHAVATPLIAIK